MLTLGCFLFDRKIVAEYEKTVAQMIGKLLPPAGGYFFILLFVPQTFKLKYVYFVAVVPRNMFNNQ